MGLYSYIVFNFVFFQLNVGLWLTLGLFPTISPQGWVPLFFFFFIWYIPQGWVPPFFYLFHMVYFPLSVEGESPPFLSFSYGIFPLKCMVTPFWLWLCCQSPWWSFLLWLCGQSLWTIGSGTTVGFIYFSYMVIVIERVWFYIYIYIYDIGLTHRSHLIPLLT